MKLLLVGFILSFHFSYCQSDLSLIPKRGQKIDYTIRVKSINWVITIPSDFKILDSIETAERIGAQEHYDNTLKALVNVTKTTMLFTALKEKYNFISASYIKSNLKLRDSVINAYDLEKKRFADLISKGLGKAPDTTFKSVVIIDGLRFQKSGMVFVINKNAKMYIFNMSHYLMNKLLTISIAYVDNATGEKIMNALYKSKFNK